MRPRLYKKDSRQEHHHGREMHLQVRGGKGVLQLWLLLWIG
jgi:hypothetical protein